MSLDPEMGITGNSAKSLPAFQGEMRKKGAVEGREEARKTFESHPKDSERPHFQQQKLKEIHSQFTSQKSTALSKIMTTAIFLKCLNI